MKRIRKSKNLTKKRKKKNEKLTLDLEGEIVSQMAAFMVAPQHEEGGGVPNFQGVQVEHALCVFNNYWGENGG